MKSNNAAGFSRLTIRRFLAGTVGALAILSFLLFSGSTPSTYAAEDISFVAVDMDTTGNNTVSCAGMDPDGAGPASAHCAPGTLGTIQTCAEVDPGGTVDVDVVVSAIPGTVTGNGGGPDIQGYDMDLAYDSTVVNVANVVNSASGGPPGNLDMEYAATPGGAHSSYTEIPPNSAVAPDPNDFYMSEIDYGTVGEFGPGILMRLTLTGVAPGSSSLQLQYTLPGDPNPRIYDNTGVFEPQNTYTIGANNPSVIKVHPDTCPPTPTPSVADAVPSMHSLADTQPVTDAKPDADAVPRMHSLADSQPDAMLHTNACFDAMLPADGVSDPHRRRCRTHGFELRLELPVGGADRGGGQCDDPAGRRPLVSQKEVVALGIFHSTLNLSPFSERGGYS